MNQTQFPLLDRRQFLRAAAASALVPLLPKTMRAQTAPAEAARAVTVVTANIRVALPEDDARGHGWAARREACARVIADAQPDIICLQEVLAGQFADLEKAWPRHVGLGFAGPEMDAHASGYHGIAKNPIFYAREHFDLVAAGGFWLSETPHLPGSMAWGTARARHVNWVRLRTRATGREFRVLNTHLDHQSQPAREKQMAMILTEAALYPAGFPQVLAGDFNVDANNPVCAQVAAAGWSDTYRAVHPVAGPEFTYHAFRGPAHGKPGAAPVTGKIDFIFMRGAWQVEGAEILRDAPGGVFPSDHYFVAAHLAERRD